MPSARRGVGILHPIKIVGIVGTAQTRRRNVPILYEPTRRAVAMINRIAIAKMSDFGPDLPFAAVAVARIDDDYDDG